MRWTSSWRPTRSVVVLGGTLGQVLDARRERVMEILHERDGVDFAQNVSVCAGGLGSDGPLLGAAEAALAPLLADPVAVMSAYRSEHDSTPETGAASSHADARPDNPGAA